MMTVETPKALEETAAALTRFPEAVLTGVDSSGYPVSVRCRPDVDRAAGALRVRRPSWLEVRVGPTSLMSHRHDEQLWGLEGFLVRGTLDIDGEDLMFRPSSFTWTAGGGLWSTIRMVAGTRRAAADYLERRKLARPRVPWDTIAAAKKAHLKSHRASGGDR